MRRARRAVLEETPLSGFSSGIATAVFSRQLVLGGGKNYWLGAFANGANQQIWQDSTSDKFALQAFSDDEGATWSTLSSDPFPRAAFRVNGTVTTQPDIGLIAEGAAWKYLRGLAEPSAGTQWTTSTFDDTAWDFGVEGFGYDTDTTTQASLIDAVHTPLPEMHEDGVNPDPFTVLYSARNFTVHDPVALDELILQLDYDDSFIAYINGIEIAHSAFGTVDTPEPFDALEATTSRRMAIRARHCRRSSLTWSMTFPVCCMLAPTTSWRFRGSILRWTTRTLCSRISLGANLSLPGDTNGDGRVDLVDLNNVRNNFGAVGVCDTNGDGIVDLDDLNNVRNHFGASLGQAVPEPTTLLAAIISTLTILPSLRFQMTPLHSRRVTRE